MTSQIGRGLAIIAAAALIGVLILSNGYGDGVDAGGTVVVVDAPVSDDDSGDDSSADDAATDDGADAADDSATDDAAADDAATDDAAADDAAADGGADATVDGGAADSAADDPTAPAVRPPAEVRVLVANGSGVDGAAGRARDTLTVNAYTVLGAVNATVTGVDAVYYTEGFQAEAVVIAELLGGTEDMVQPMPDFPPVLDLLGADILVVLGPVLAQPS